MRERQRARQASREPHSPSASPMAVDAPPADTEFKAAHASAAEGAPSGGAAAEGAAAAEAEAEPGAAAAAGVHAAVADIGATPAEAAAVGAAPDKKPRPTAAQPAECAAAAGAGGPADAMAAAASGEGAAASGGADAVKQEEAAQAPQVRHSAATGASVRCEHVGEVAGAMAVNVPDIPGGGGRTTSESCTFLD